MQAMRNTLPVTYTDSSATTPCAISDISKGSNAGHRSSPTFPGPSFPHSAPPPRVDGEMHGPRRTWQWSDGSPRAVVKRLRQRFSGSPAPVCRWPRVIQDGSTARVSLSVLVGAFPTVFGPTRYARLLHGASRGVISCSASALGDANTSKCMLEASRKPPPREAKNHDLETCVCQA